MTLARNRGSGRARTGVSASSSSLLASGVPTPLRSLTSRALTDAPALLSSRLVRASTLSAPSRGEACLGSGSNDLVAAPVPEPTRRDSGGRFIVERFGHPESGG